MRQLNKPQTQQFIEHISDAQVDFFEEKEVITDIFLELSAARNSVSKQEIILSLICRIELEEDPEKIEIYRKSLEIVVNTNTEDWNSL